MERRTMYVSVQRRTIAQTRKPKAIQVDANEEEIQQLQGLMD
ncbi:hypothetical protein [Paenibacillus popilliae]|nr:hypothetical protein [Paenibacillus popilliae]